MAWDAQMQEYLARVAPRHIVTDIDNVANETNASLTARTIQWLKYNLGGNRNYHLEIVSDLEGNVDITGAGLEYSFNQMAGHIVLQDAAGGLNTEQ